MAHDNVAWLIKKGKRIVDEDGNPTNEYARRQIFVEEESVGQKEFFQASQAGLRVSFVLKTFEHNYKGEELLEYRGKQYRVYRSYTNNKQTTLERAMRGEKIRLYCEERA